MIVHEALRRASRTLAPLADEEAALEAELLLCHALGPSTGSLAGQAGQALDRSHLYQRLRDEFDPEHERAFQRLLERRLAHEPTAYILGRREFYGLEFEVTPAAIIPRPETEVLVEAVLAFVRALDTARETWVADVGTGCGAIAVALAANLPPGVRLIALDSSGEALALARRNAERHGVAERMHFLRGDLLSPLQGSAHPEPKPGGSRDSSRRVDVIAANLPYVPTTVWQALPPEIRDHEPRLGLDGGPDGLRLIERLLRRAPRYLPPRGALFAEIGDEQGGAAAALAREAFPAARIEVKPDLGGLDRVLVVET